MTRQSTDWPLGPLTPEEFPNGVYVASYRDWVRKSYFGQPKIRLDFEIVEPPHDGVLLSLFATLTPDQNRRPSRAAKYFQLWVKANGGPPQRGQRMSPSVFAGYWKVKIEWSRNKKTGELTMPIITELIERVAGGGAAA